MTPTVRVLADADAAARAVAARLEELAGSALSARGEFSVAVSGGRTPEPMFRALAGREGGASVWHGWQVFWCDERLVPVADDRSNAGLARRLWLDPCGFPRSNMHEVPTDPPVEEAARRYDATLRTFFHPGERDGPDVVVLGIGPDGHTASLFPGSPALEVTGRWAVAVPTPGQPPPVPRVTMTLEALARARNALFLVTGADKRPALAQILSPASSRSKDAPLPAARVASAGAVEWFLDRAAAPA